MPHLKILTVLATLALLTACGGGGGAPAITSNNNTNNIDDTPCETNPFGSTCLTDTDLNPRRVSIVSDCRTDDTGALCTDAIKFVCGKNIRDGLCRDTVEYKNLIQMEQTTCLTNNSKEFCDNQARVKKCDASPFFGDCTEEKYITQRRRECESLKNNSQCMATEELICGVNGDVFDPFCDDLTSTDTARETSCQTHGTDPNDGDPSCATILIPFCTIADPFAHAGCDDVVNINADIRTPYCEALATAWDEGCIDTTHGIVNATRITACQMFGTNTNMGGHDICATSLAASCTVTDPFAYMGCNNVVGIAGIRMMYCQTPATAWDEECIDATHGTVSDTRMTACQMFGTDTDTGGHDSCADSLIPLCLIADPFIHEGCDDVVGIDDGVRTMYCALTANIFKTGCKTDGTHGPVLTAQRDACLKFGTGTGGHGSCIGNTQAEISCALNPFDPLKPGCAILTELPMIVETYCTTTNPSAIQCGVKTRNWVENARNANDTADLEVRGVGAALANDKKYTLITGGAESLELGDAVAKHATVFGDLTFKSTVLPVSSSFRGETAFTASPNVAGGISYASNAGVTKFYAGLLSDTDVGLLLEAAPTANWVGRLAIVYGEAITADSSHAVADFQLMIDFANPTPTLSQTVRLNVGDFYGQVIIAGEFNDKGVIYGTTTYQLINSSSNAVVSSGTGLLTGLIGQKGAAAVFHRTAGTTNFIGGFVATPYVPAEDDFPNKVTFRDWVREFDYPLPTSALVEEARITAPSHFIRPKAGEMLADGERFDLTGFTGTTERTARRNDTMGNAGYTDGFIYGFGTIDNRTHSFVGILPSTDLGAPLTEAIAMATWYGHVRFSNSATPNPTEFELTFDGTNRGTIDAVTGNNLTLDLMFDDKGIITGDVTSRLPGLEGTAPARGLIGEEGLVGVFANVNGGPSAYTLYGGFVAQPGPPPVANQAAWVASFNGGVPARLTATTTASDRKRQFLAGGETALIDINDTIGVPVYFGLTFKSAMYNGAALSGDNDIKDGFAGLVDTVSGVLKVYYVGILSGTDLGRPLKETVGSITWNGQIETVRAGLADIKKDFSLKITLGESNGVSGALGSIAGAVLSDGTNHYQLTGTYDVNGVITGEVIYGEFTGSIAGGDLETEDDANGILTGLIGQYGAVGVFLAGGGTKEAIPDAASATDGYAGGFVVSGAPPPRQPVVQPDDINANQVTFKDWLRDFGGFPPPDRLTAPPRERRREFLAGGTAGLATTDTVNVTKTITANLASLGRSGDATDGYQYFIDRVATSPNIFVPYAGLLSGTDLGARVTGTTGTTVTWHGKLRATLNGTLNTDANLALTITYGGTGDVAGSIAGEVKANGSNSLYQLRGEYDTSGVIDGTVYYGGVNQVDLPDNLVRTFPSEDPNGFLTGLIGAQGAVGVFISGTGTKGDIGSPTGNYYAGGFIVAPE